MISRRALLSRWLLGLFSAPLYAAAQQPGTVDASLAFFEAVEVGRAAPTHPERYERRAQSPGPDLYIARMPALVIRANEIISVVVERIGDRYRATIRTDPNATQRLQQFTERNIGTRVDIRFGAERLAILRIVAPVPSGLVAPDVRQ